MHQVRSGKIHVCDIMLTCVPIHISRVKIMVLTEAAVNKDLGGIEIDTSELYHLIWHFTL